MCRKNDLKNLKKETFSNTPIKGGSLKVINNKGGAAPLQTRSVKEP
jgi:hypothetical protein